MKSLMSNDKFIEKLKNIHGNKYDYSKVYFTGWRNKVILSCPEHGDFSKRSDQSLNSGCPKCSSLLSNTDEFIKRAKEVHGDTYDYSEVNYINNNTPVNILCSKHGFFAQMPTSHINRGNGCPKCGRDRISNLQKLSLETFIKRANKIHGNKYDYSKIENYVNEKTKLEIVCPDHGSFWQSARSHLCKGHGCPLCRESSLEKSVRLCLSKNELLFETQKTWDWLKYERYQYVDYYLPEYNIVIECQGLQHFKSSEFFNKDADLKKIQDRDENKRKLCEEHGIKVFYYSNLGIEYPYQVYEDLEILINEIKKISPTN